MPLVVGGEIHAVHGPEVVTDHPDPPGSTSSRAASRSTAARCAPPRPGCGEVGLGIGRWLGPRECALGQDRDDPVVARQAARPRRGTGRDCRPAPRCRTSAGRGSPRRGRRRPARPARRSITDADVMDSCGRRRSRVHRMQVPRCRHCTYPAGALRFGRRTAKCPEGTRRPTPATEATDAVRLRRPKPPNPVPEH